MIDSFQIEFGFKYGARFQQFASDTNLVRSTRLRVKTTKRFRKRFSNLQFKKLAKCVLDEFKLQRH